MEALSSRKLKCLNSFGVTAEKCDEPNLVSHICFEVVGLHRGWVVYCWWCKGWVHNAAVTTAKMQAHRDSCKHKHITLAASVYYAQTHLPNPALSSALSQRASGFKNKWRAWPFIMFRTLFFLRLECGQECVVALLALRGRKTYHAILLQKKRREVQKDREARQEREERGNRDLREREKKKKKKVVWTITITEH